MYSLILPTISFGIWPKHAIFGHAPACVSARPPARPPWLSRGVLRRLSGGSLGSSGDLVPWGVPGGPLGSPRHPGGSPGIARGSQGMCGYLLGEPWRIHRGSPGDPEKILSDSPGDPPWRPQDLPWEIQRLTLLLDFVPLEGFKLFMQLVSRSR